MDISDVKNWIDAASGTVGLLRAAAKLLPKGEKRDEIEARISAAEEALKRSDAKLAKELGMNLCDCTFPPQIMLWKEAEKSHVCPNLACGRRQRKGMHISQEALDRAASWKTT